MYPELTPERLNVLETLYDKANVEGKEVFMFEGNEMFTGYVKYLLEYYKNKV
jgi:hypothetical protein